MERGSSPPEIGQPEKKINIQDPPMRINLSSEELTKDYYDTRPNTYIGSVDGQHTDLNQSALNTNQKWNVSVKEKEYNPIQEYKQFVTSLFKAKSQRNPVSKPVTNQPLTKHIRWDKIDYSRVAS